MSFLDINIFFFEALLTLFKYGKIVLPLPLCLVIWLETSRGSGRDRHLNMAELYNLILPNRDVFPKSNYGHKLYCYNRVQWN